MVEDDGGDAGGEGGDQGGDGGSGQAEGTFTDPDTGETYQFPKDTALADMTEAQRTEYWRHKARKHEGAAKARADYDAIKAERDQLKAAGMTDAEKAVEEARNQAAAAAQAEARAQFSGRLVQAEMKAALAGKIPAEKVAGHVEFLDVTKFLTEAGEVDTDKVQQYAAGLAPAGGQWPDMGGGSRGGSGKSSGLEAGRDLWAERHKKSK